jgi:nitrogen fixation protein FixH
MNAESTARVNPSFNPWPVGIVVFFALAIMGCAGFVAFCSRHPADLVAADYYEQEVRYQAQIDRVLNVSEQARGTAITYDPTAGLIAISIPQTRGEATPVGRVELYRPSSAALDRQLKLEPNANGLQTIDARALQPGLWKVRVTWKVDQKDYFIDKKIIIGSPSS